MVRRYAIVCLFVLLHPWVVFAQSNATDGALEGFVRDPSAASVPNATVVATNLRTGQVSSEATSREGYYRFPLLQVGEYELLVTASGFGEYRRAGIRLSAAQYQRDVDAGLLAGVDVALVLGGASE